MPKPRSAPCRTSGPVAAKVSTAKSTWPPTTALSAGPLPWNGTWTVSTLSRLSTIRVMRCAAAPAPEVA